MASASAGRSSKKGGSRLQSSKPLRTVGKTKNGRFATKSEMKNNSAANAKMKQSFKRSIAGLKGARNRQS